jgi:DNA polymerase/3'-5' exonuclease PolX
MTTTVMGKGRVTLELAQEIAAEIVGLLSPFCSRIEVAGSIRRRKAEVGDIEIVCVPKIERQMVPTLFGEEPGDSVNRLDEEVREMVLGGSYWGTRPDVNGRSAVGERYKRLSYRGIGLDLFSVLPPAQWGVLYLIRTGCAEFSHRLVTPRLMGGWLPTGFKVSEGSIIDGSSGVAMNTPGEADIFRFLGAPYLEPEQRTATVRLRPTKGHDPAWIWSER